MNMPRLKGKMAERGYSQRSLAKEIGISENTMGAKLKGESSFDCVEASKICDVLNIVDSEEKTDIFLS